MTILSPETLNHYLSESEIKWLVDPSSLTKKLREFTHNKITFHVLQDAWGIADDASRVLLSIPAEEKTWLRHIEWRFENRVWIDAVVVIPDSSLQNAPELNKIGKNPIGDILFQDPTLLRDEFIFEKMGNNFLRRSVFRFKKQPLLINETFLPNFFARARSH